MDQRSARPHPIQGCFGYQFISEISTHMACCAGLLPGSCFGLRSRGRVGSVSLRAAQEGDQVGEQGEGGLLDGRIVFDDGQFAHGVGVEDQDVAEPADGGQRIENLQLLRRRPCR